MCGESTAASSHNTTGMQRVNDGVHGSENIAGAKANNHGNSRYVTSFFYNSAMKPKEVNTLMARKSKNDTAAFPGRVRTQVFV